MTSQAKSLSLYIVAIALVSGSNFLIVPVLLSAIGPQQFAVWALLEPVLLLLVPLSGFGIQFALMQRLALKEDAKSLVSALFAPYVLLAALSGTAAFTLVALMHHRIEIAVFLGATVFLEGTIVFFIFYWRAQDRALHFLMIEGGRAFVVLIFTALLYWLGHSLLRDLGGYLLIRMTMAAVALAAAVLLVRPGFLIDPATFRRSVRFGLPVVVAGALVTSLLNFDRFVVLWATGETQVAYYVAHTKVVQILAASLAPFFIWYAPKAIAGLNRAGAEHGFLVRNFFGFVTVNVGLSVGLWLILPSAWPLVFPGAALNLPLMAWLIFGMAVFSCGNPLSVGTLTDGKSHQALLVTLAALCLGVALIFPLAAAYGQIGVAIGKCAAMMVYTGLFAVSAISATKADYRWLRIGGIILFGLLVSTILPYFIDLSAISTGVPVAFTAALSVLLCGFALRPAPVDFERAVCP